MQLFPQAVSEFLSRRASDPNESPDSMRMWSGWGKRRGEAVDRVGPG